MTDDDTVDEDVDVLSTVAAKVHRVVEMATEATEGDVDQETIEDVHEVIEELAEFVEEVDLTEGAKALELPEDLDAPRDAVDVPELDERVDLRDAWREFRELQEEIEELRETGYDAESDDEMEWGDAESDDEMELDEVHSTELELAIQSAVADAVETFREEILAARERLEDAIDDVDDRTVDDPDSRNPSAFSMLPSERGDMGRNARGSTVPRETRYSKTPNYERIYGDRFDDPSEGDDE